MSKLRSAGLFQKKKAARYLIGFILVCLFAVFVIRLNQVEKTELVVRTGQTFEKAEVVKILQDNLEDNGTRVGEQKVRVRMLTGVRKGEELDITSSSGYLFGAPCSPGMKVIVMQSVAGESTVASVYSQDREWVIYIFAALYLLALCIIGGWQGIKGCSGTGFYLFLRDLCIPSTGVPELFPILVWGIYLFYHHSCDHVPDRWGFKKDHSGHTGNLGGSYGGWCGGMVLQ